MVESAVDGAITLDLPYTTIASVQCAGDAVVFVGATPTAEPAIVSVPLDAFGPGAATVVRQPPRPRFRPRLVLASRADRLSYLGRAHRPRHLLPADQPRCRPAERRATATPRRRPRGPYRCGPAGAPAWHPVLDEPRVCCGRRELRRLNGLRAQLPSSTRRQLGRRRRRRLCGGCVLAGGAPSGRLGPVVHQGRFSGRLHDACLRWRFAGHVRGRRQPLRHRRPGGDDYRDTQVREPLPRRTRRHVPRSPRRLRRAFTRSTTSSASTGR